MKRVFLSLSFLIMAGCFSMYPASPSKTPSILYTMEKLPTKSIALSPTPVLILTPTLTLTPVPTSTYTSTPLPTWTALPTLESKKGLQTYYAWFSGNEECRLPCWAGITPGQTGWMEAKQILQPLTGIAELTTSLDSTCTFGRCNEITWAFPFDLNDFGYVYSRVEDSKIQSMRFQLTDFTESYLIKSLNLQKILTLYGKPTILLFSTEPDLPGDLFLDLVMAYPDNQFILRYSKHAKLISNSVVSCGQDSVIELNILDNKEQLVSVEAIANAPDTQHLHVDVWHKSVEEALGMTADKFYETYRKANAPCITTPVKVWMP